MKDYCRESFMKYAMLECQWRRLSVISITARLHFSMASRLRISVRSFILRIINMIIQERIDTHAEVSSWQARVDTDTSMPPLLHYRSEIYYLLMMPSASPVSRTPILLIRWAQMRAGIWPPCVRWHIQGTSERDHTSISRYFLFKLYRHGKCRFPPEAYFQEGGWNRGRRADAFEMAWFHAGVDEASETSLLHSFSRDACKRGCASQQTGMIILPPAGKSHVTSSPRGTWYFSCHEPPRASLKQLDAFIFHICLALHLWVIIKFVSRRFVD